MWVEVMEFVNYVGSSDEVFELHSIYATMTTLRDTIVVSWVAINLVM